MIMKERMVRGMLVFNRKAKLNMNGSSNGFRKIKNKYSPMEVMRDRTVQTAIKINMASVLLVSIWKKIMSISTYCLERAWLDCQVLKTFHLAVIANVLLSRDGF